MNPPSSSSVRRWLRRAGWILLGSWLAYLAVGNAFLNVDAAQSLLKRKPEKFQIAWDGGHTLLPGRVALRGVRMQGHARRTAWTAQAAHARGRIALLPLLAREIRIPWLEAEVVTGSVERADGDIPSPAHRPGGWTLRFDRIASDSIEGGRVFGVHVAGSGRAEVGFSKQFRGGPAELFPSTASFSGLSMGDGEVQWMHDGAVEAAFSMPALPSGQSGQARLQALQASLALQGRPLGLRAELDDAGRYAFHLAPGAEGGELDARLSLRNGALEPGGTLRLQLPLRARDADGAASDNALALRVEVDEDLHLQAQLPDRDPAQPSLDVELRLPGNALPLGDWRTRLVGSEGHVRGRWHMPSIGGVLALFMDSDWLALEGSGGIEADLQIGGGRLREGSTLRVRDVQARADVLDTRFEGVAHADAVLAREGEGGLQSRVELVMEEFSAARHEQPAQPLVSGRDLRVRLVSDGQLERMRETLAAHLVFKDARVPDIAALNAWLPSDGLRFGGGSGTLGADLRLDAAGDIGTGSLRVDARRARIEVAGLELAGDVAIDGRLRGGNLRDGRLSLDGSRVRLRNVAFRERDGQLRSGWWATVDIGRGEADWKSPVSARGDIQARMRDVGFLLAMFADRGDYPPWIGRLVDAGEARLRGRWAWRDGQLVLDGAHAENDRFTVDARMKIEGSRRRGDLHLAWGRLGVGMELDGAEHRLHLRNSRAWFDSRPSLLP
ncbi:hypothetical protein [Luteimonas terricola]|nr:hypothetical protein [Luteimonas terricola]